MKYFKFPALSLRFVVEYVFELYRVEFVVGDKPVEKFRMVERHYFHGQLLKSFDFDFGFCIPNSKNTCEHIYELPVLSKTTSKFLVLFVF